MRNLSKSKLIAYRQCPKRIWLEVHRPDLREDSDATQASFAVGNTVGDIAHQLYDPKGVGVLLDAQRDGFEETFKRSLELLASEQPIFEAGYTANGALAFADVMLPDIRDGKRVWRMVEVKSSTHVKDYHRDDVAVQSYIARSAGVPLASVALAHINSGWVYPGEGDYQGLLEENDLTAEAFARYDEVQEWITAAHEVVEKEVEPEMKIGGQCASPFACGFFEYCQSQEPQAEYPVHWLPSIRANAIKEYIAEHPALDLRDTPDDLLNELQLRVKNHTLSGEIYFNPMGAADALKSHRLPAYFLDFETIQFAVPIWKGTRPYQMIPFQFSLHVLDEGGKLESQEFLDLSGNDPSRAFAERLIAVCGRSGPVFVYNAGFEGARIGDLAERFPEFATPLQAINERLVDLLPMTRANYYHPSQHGSWSIKAVLPAVAPDLSYESLDGVKNGGMAMEAYEEAIHPDTTSQRKAEIEQQLLAYCGLDTFAMVRLWQFLAGRKDLHFE
jgi:predicted RecB family nuclease